VALVEQHTMPPSIGVEARWTAAHRDISRRLALRYDGVDVELIEAIVARHFETFVDARITLYVPVLVERAAADDLRRSCSALGLRRR